MDGKEHEPEPWRRYPYGDQDPASTDANDGVLPGRPEPLPRRPTATYGTTSPYGQPPPYGQSAPSYSSLQFDTATPLGAEPGNGHAPPGGYPTQYEYGSGAPSWADYGTGRFDTADRFDPGALTYGDLLYAQGRHTSPEATTDTAAPSRPRHAHVDHPAAVRPSMDRTTTTGGFAAVGAGLRSRRRAPDPVETDDEERRHMPLWQELPLLLVVAFCLAVLIRSFLLQAFFIPSSSMEQTLLIGDRVLVNKVIYDLREPRRGEVIVFSGTNDWAPENYTEPASGVFSRIGRTLGDLVGVSHPGEKDFIKRVIGLPGDHVSCCDQGRVVVNGVPIEEPYIYVNSSLDVPPSPHTCGSRRFDEIVVPPGELWVMGDHRAVSQDSRCQGPVPIENVIGRAFVIVWPSNRWDTLDVPDTFDNVPTALSDPSAPTPKKLPDQGAAIVTLPILVTLVGSARTGRRRRSRTRTLRR